MIRLRVTAGLAVVVTLFVSAIVWGQQAPRTWTDASGKYRIRAQLVDVEEGQAMLLTEEGRRINVPLAKLSREDQAFVRAEMKRRAAPPAVTETGPAVGEWPRWRGANNDGKSRETGLLRQWSGEPPKDWHIRGLGQGYSSLSVAEGRIYTLGERAGGQFLIALNAQDGSELWSTRVGDPGRDGPNGTPTIDGDLVFAVGINGDLLCADAASGEQRWRKSYSRDFGGKMMSQWGYSESPLVDGDKLICTPGGPRAMMAALNKRTGAVIWTTPLPPGGERGQDGAGYSSAVISNGAGVKQYVQLVGRGVIGVAADRGQLLWGYDRIANRTANIPTPIVHGDYVFCSSGYPDGGTALLRLNRRGGSFEAQEVYYHPAGEMQNHHGGMILVDGHVYMGDGHNKGLPLCVKLDSGRPAWGPVRGPGGSSAAVAYADGDLYFRYQDGTVALIEATPEEYRLKGTFRTDFGGGGPKWSHPVIAHGKLYLRNGDELACYDIRRDAG